MGGPSSPPPSPTGPDAPVAAAATLPRDPSTPAGREDARTAAVASSPSPALQPLQRSAPAAPTSASEPTIDAVARASPPTLPPTPSPLQSRLPRANRRLLSATTEIQLPQDAFTFRPKLSPTLTLSEPASSGDQVAELLRSALHISSYSRSAPRPPQPSPTDGIVEGATAVLVLDSPAHRLRRRHASSGAAGAGLFAFRSRIPVPIGTPPVASLRSASAFRSSARPSPYPSAGERRHRAAGSQAASQQVSPGTAKAKLEERTISRRGRRNSWSSFELNGPACFGSAVDAISPASSPLDLALLTVAFQSVVLTPQPASGAAPRPIGDGKPDSKLSTFFVPSPVESAPMHPTTPTPALIGPSVPTNKSPPTSPPTKSTTPAPSQPPATAPLTHNPFMLGERRRPRAIASFGSPLLHAKGLMHRSAPRFSVTVPVGVLHNPRPRQARRAKAAAVTATTFAPVATIRRHRQMSTGHSARVAIRKLGSLHAPVAQRPDGRGVSTQARRLPGSAAVLTPSAASAGGSSPRPVASAFWVPIRSSRAVRSGASSAFLPAPVLGRTPPPPSAASVAAAAAAPLLSCRSTTAFSTAPYARARSANAAATAGGGDGVRADVAEEAAGADGGSGSDTDASSEDGGDGDDERRLAALFDRSVRVDGSGGSPDAPRQRAPFVC
ncbi:hypothetical protein HK405_005301 [Cladochytrium tenue]|nr:hypothetical protein HK405_005301 [Cladochytrium tenue]